MELDIEGHRLLAIQTSDDLTRFPFTFQKCWPIFIDGKLQKTTPLYYYEVEYRRAEVDIWLKNSQQKGEPFPREIYFIEGRGKKRVNLNLAKIRYGLNSFAVLFPEE